jgi:D-glycero-alpha-D-manno-heptose-7-phosphate kinase
VLVSSRTPLRVSLFGGGSDYPEWFRRHPGAVLGFAIDKYIYISALRLPEFVDYRYRLTWSQLEREQRVADLQHPAVRAILERYRYDQPLDLSVQADLPANAGLGSSSSFAVGMLNLLSALQHTPRTRLELAQLAIELEHEVLNERVGIQDQLHAAFGGLNRFDFFTDQIKVSPVQISGSDLAALADWMLLVYSGSKRHASAKLEDQMESTSNGSIDSKLDRMVELVDLAQTAFERHRGEALGLALAELLRESWALKRGLSGHVSNTEIDALYDACMARGALAGKVCGAGGGGFLLIVVPPDARQGLIDHVGAGNCVSFGMDHEGSTVRQHW